MKKKRIICVVVLAAVLLGSVYFLYYTNQQHPLPQICPLIAGAACHANIVWDGTGGSETQQAAIAQEELSRILNGAVLKRGGAFEATPSPAFEITVPGDAESCSIVVGFDGSVAVANRSDLEGTRTFWKDASGKLFLKLYECHLLGGGVKVP